MTHACALHMLQGPQFDLVIDGGSCEEDIVTGIITCTQPSVTLTKTPGACNLKYTSPTVIQVQTYLKYSSVCCRTQRGSRDNGMSRVCMPVQCCS